jgi:hypothetical protein
VLHRGKQGTQHHTQHTAPRSRVQRCSRLFLLLLAHGRASMRVIWRPGLQAPTRSRPCHLIAVIVCLQDRLWVIVGAVNVCNAFSVTWAIQRWCGDVHHLPFWRWAQLSTCAVLPLVAMPRRPYSNRGTERTAWMSHDRPAATAAGTQPPAHRAQQQRDQHSSSAKS